MDVARRSPMSAVPEQLPDQRQILANHHGLTGGGMAPKVMQAKPAVPRIRVHHPPARSKVPAFGVAREQECAGTARTGKYGDVRQRGRAVLDAARISLRVARVQGIGSDVPPAEIEHFATAIFGERQQAERGDGLGPAGFVGG